MKKVFINSAIAVLAACAFASCAKDNLKPADVETSLHFSITTAEDSPLKSYLDNNLDGTYTPKWSKGDKLAMFVGGITSSTSEPTAILSNQNDDGVIAKFDGDVPTSLTEGSFLSFSPAGAFAKGYSDGTVGINLSEIQNPSSLTIDEACDILVAKPCNYMAEAGTVVIEDLYFKRIFSVLKVNLSGVDALKTEKVKSFTISAPVTLTGRAAVDLSTASISKWYIENKAVTANYSEDCPVFGGENGSKNTIWFVVNPTSVASGSKVTFSGETENYTFSKEVTLSKDLVFPQSQIAVINLKLGEGNYAAKTTETRILVEGFDNVKTSKTQLQPSATGASGTGVTEALAYEYSGKNTNLRFNGNGHSSTNPYLYLSLKDDNLIISNIKISGETALKFSCQAKTNSGSSTITINYKESSSDTWLQAGTVSAGTGTFDKVNSFVFAVSSEATSLDMQIVASAAALVDDLVLESYVDTRSTLAAPVISCTAQTENSLTFTWKAVANASGYQVSTDGGVNYGTTQTETTYTWSGLDAESSYTLYVKAIGDGTSYTDSDAAFASGTTTAASHGGAKTTTLSNANITAVANPNNTQNTGYRKLTYTDDNDFEYSAYAISTYHSKATSQNCYIQIKKYEKNTAYYVKLPQFTGNIKSIHLVVSGASQTMNGGGNKATIYFSSSNSTSAAGNNIVSGEGASEITIDASSLNLNTGYLTASGAVRIWEITVEYSE